MKQVVDNAEKYILNAIRNIQFGSVEIIIHNSQIVQVTKSEKQRFKGGIQPA